MSAKIFICRIMNETPSGCIHAKCIYDATFRPDQPQYKSIYACQATGAPCLGQCELNINLESEKPVVDPKNCSNCSFVFCRLGAHPCVSCSDHDKWVPRAEKPSKPIYYSCLGFTESGYSENCTVLTCRHKDVNPRYLPCVNCNRREARSLNPLAKPSHWEASDAR